MNIKNLALKKRLLFFVPLLLLIMSGCGGGGGGGSDASGSSTGTSVQPGSGTNNTQSVVAATVSGNLSALANSGAQTSISKAFAPILFSKQNITITDSRAKINLEQVTIRLEALRNDPQNPSLVLPAILLAETISNSDGSYNLPITETSLSQTNCGATACKTWQELLTIPNPAYRLRISFFRGAGQRADSIDSTVEFRPVYNNSVLTSTQANQIRLDATINMLDQKNTRLEIASTLGTLIVESNIDTSGNNIASPTPLVVFRQSVGSGTEQRTILEVDGDGNGVFGESTDAVPGRVFLEPQDLDKPEFQSFLDKPLTTFIDTNNSGKPSVVNFDTTSAVLQFVSPLPAQVVAKQPITIRLQYGDDLGFQLSTLKISTSAGLKITNPFEQIPVGASGASSLTAKFRKERLDFTQIQTGALKTLATSSWMLGEATFTIPDPLAAWGPGTVTLTASIENFSSNAAVSTVTQSITFSVDGPPEFIDPFLSINTAEGATYNGLTNQPVQVLTARDVMPVTVRYEVIPSTDAARMSWLSLNLNGLLNPISLSTHQNPIVTVTSNMLQDPTTKILRMHFAGSVPQNFKNPPQIRVTVRDADGNQSSRTIGLSVRTENVNPEWVSICSIPKNNSNHFSLNPQLVCTSSAMANQSGLAVCQSGGIGQLSFPEREPATIVLCAYDEDLEDRARFTPASISYVNPTQPNLPSTASLLSSNPTIQPGTEISTKQFRLLRSETGTYLVTASSAGTIAWFDWTPPSIYGLSPTLINWRMGDGIVTLPLITSTLEVITIPDAPVLVSLNASGAKTNNDFYASNGISTLSGIDEFRPYLSDLSQPIDLNLLPKRINARQGELYTLSLLAEDDETPLPQVSLFDSVFVSDSNGTILTDAWLKRQISTGDDELRKIVLSGTPTNEDSLKTVVMTVVTTDPTLDANPISRYYRIPVEVLDQNDPPRFSSVPTDTLTNIPSITAAQASESVTITVNATEDQLLRFYIHAFDTDPVGSPFRDASRFVFSLNEDQLNTKISKMEVTTSATDPSRAVALFEWRPESRDTNESIPEGVNQIKQNRMQVIVRALCPTDLFFGTTCLEPSRTVDVLINVQAVDDPPIFDRLTVNGVIQANASTPIRLVQGQTVDILQFVREEEAGQLFDQIQIINPDTTLSFLLNGVSRSLNDGNPLGSSIRMQGAPSNDSVEYVQRTIDGVVQFVPKTVNLTLRAVPRGSGVVSTRVLSFEIEDGPDAPTFTGLPNPAIYTVDERQSLDITLVATNTLDKNPAFKTGFIFRSITNQLPNPVGNFQVFSSSTNSQNTTGRMVWTPGTEHTNGVNDKSHTVGIEVCLQASPTTCRQQQIVINVRAVDDPPLIFWGAQGRDLVANPFTVNDPFVVQENSSFSQIVKAIDPDGERVRITAEFKLVSPSQVPGQFTTIVAGVPLIGAGSGKTADITPVSNTPSDQNPAPDINGFQPPVEMTVGWSSIDWQSISTSPSLPATALYELTLRAVPPVGSALTEVKVPILLQSVNDAPNFTTSVIPGFVGQNSTAGTIVATLTELILDEENHPIRFTITNRFGNAQNFVEPLLLNGNQVVLSAIPGENNVGIHQIEVRADEEGITDPLTTVRVLSFSVRDSNDAPFFVNSFESAQNVQEGSTSVLSVGLIDRDLASSPQSESLSYVFEYSLNNSPFVTMSFQSVGSGTQATYTTALPYNISWTTLPVSPVSGQTGLSVTVNPMSLPDFDPRTLVLRIIATDSFESQFLTTQTSLTYNIRAIDDIPVFTHLQSLPITAGSSFSLLCFDNPCTDTGRIVRQSQVQSFHITSFNAENNTVDPVMFRFASLFGSTVLSTAPVGVSLVSTANIAANTASATFQLAPTNSQIGLNRITLLVEDKSDNDVNSVNVRQFSTHTLGWFVQDLADPPSIVDIRCVSQGCVYTSGVIEVQEDMPLGIEITITDPDLFSPKSFSSEEVQFMQSTMGLSITSINQIAATLFANEYFEYVLTNLTPYPSFRIASAASPTTTLFAFSTPSNLIVTNTTSVIQMQWASPSDLYTFPKLGGNITWNFRVRSFAANSVDTSRPTSVSTGVVVRVIPVNDRPVILNTQIEAQATEGLPFTFQIVATDEEEVNLNYLFEGAVPGNMSISPAGLIQWLPTNDDTVAEFYDIKVFVQDNGRVSSASLDTTTPLSSILFPLRVFLTDVDAPAIHDSAFTPSTTAVEDLLYAAQIRFTDEDKNDIPHYFLEHIRRNGQPIQSNFNIQEVDNSVDGNGRGPVQITWTPSLGGTYDIRIRVSSVKNEIVRSSVFYDFQVQVEEVNDPPVFAAIDPSPLFENVPYIRNIIITDEDGDVPVLSLGNSPGCSMPPFLQLSAVERRISGGTNLAGFEDQEISLGTTPLQTYLICLEANDGQITTTYSYVLNIRASNNPPTIVRMFSKSGTDPVSNQLEQSQILESAEPIVTLPIQNRRITLKEDLANQVTLEFFNEEGDQPQTFSLAQGPVGVSLNTTQSTSKTAILTLTWTPGASHVTKANDGTPVPGKSPVLFRIAASDSRGASTNFEFEADVLDNPTKPCVRLVNSSCNPNPPTTTIIRNINEDQIQSLFLDAVDFDPNSTLSFSIVTSTVTNPHPINPVYLHNVSGNPRLKLELGSDGNLTFLAEISEANILGTTVGVSNLVPVTFSICGTSRLDASHPQDCTTATYTYSIQAFNDAPVFAPSFPVSQRTTAAEGGNYIGLSFRQVQTTSHCNLNILQLQEICVTDEESNTPLLVSTAANAGFLLRIDSPNPAPSGMNIGAGVPQCLATTGINNACLDPVNLNCNACLNHHFTTKRDMLWQNIGFLEPASRNISVQAREVGDPTKLTNFSFTIEIENKNRPPKINFGNPLTPLQINESSPFTLNLAAMAQDEDGDPLTYRLTKGVSGMTINTNTGILNWNPNKSHVGIHKIEIGVSDISTASSKIMSTTTAILQITVQRVNNPPRIDTSLRSVNNISQVIPHQATQGQFFEASILAIDEEGDSFTFLEQFSLGSKLNGNPLPSGFITSFGRINWTPTNANVGPNTLTVVARDSSSPNSPLSSQTFVINVLNINDSPVISPKDLFAVAVPEGQLFTRQYSVADPDAGDSHVYDVSSSPSVANLLSASGTPALTILQNGLLSFHPNFTMAGTYQITVTATDLAGASDSHSFQVNVLETNNPPILEDVPPIFVPRDTTLYTAQLYASDPEGNTINYFFVSNPSNVTLNQSTGLLTVTSKPSDPNQTFEVYAQDSFGQKSQNRTVVINYVPANAQLPQIVSNPPLVGKILTEYTFTPTVSTVGQNARIESVESTNYKLPVGMLITNSSVIWTPQIKDLGVHLVKLRPVATIDGVEVKGPPMRYLLTVTNQNNPPVLSLATAVNGDPISTYDATEGIPFSQVVAYLTEPDLEDAERLQIVFNNQNRSDSGTSNPLSEAEAIISVIPEPVTTNPLKLGLVLTWTPDNAAAFAPANGFANSFSIIGSDGISDSNILTITFNVTNVNNQPILYPDENSSDTEIGYIGQTYERTFYARDPDGQITYFCLDTSIKPAVNQEYPGFRTALMGGFVQYASGNRFYLTNGSEPSVSGAIFPDNSICMKGTLDNSSVNPRRGQLSKIKVRWDSVDQDINPDIYANLPLIPFDGFDKGSVSRDYKFTIKAAPTISNITPNKQFIGREVVIAGSGLIVTNNPQTAKFLDSKGNIVATTSLYGISTTGTARMTIPQGAKSGMVAIGFSSFSPAYPFTVLDGETSQIAGYTTTDVLSSPSGMAVTFSADNLKEWIFVSDFERHTIHLYELATGFGPINGINYGADHILRSEVIAGLTGQSGDINGSKGISRLHRPSGLSIARYDSTTWLVIADTYNHKIKLLDLTDLYRTAGSPNNNFPVYTLSNSTHLNRPYKAIQHPTLNDRFYIANTFNNTIELFVIDPGKVVPDIGKVIAPASRANSEFSTTVSGSGNARVDLEGNVFKPIDLAFNAGGELLVSSYSGSAYSYQNSSKLFHKIMPNRKDSEDSPAYTRYSAFLNDFSLGKLSKSSIYDGDLLFTSRSITSDRNESLGFSTVLSNTTAGVHSGHFFSSSKELLFDQPRINNITHNAAIEASAPVLVAVTSAGRFHYQSKELEFLDTVSSVATIINTFEGTTAAVWATVKTSSVNITPASSDDTYQLSAFTEYSLPNAIKNLTAGTISFYDVNSDFIDDLIIPEPNRGEIYIFPGKVSGGAVPANNGNIFFDTENYWLFNSSSFGNQCLIEECLKGVQHVGFGRVVASAEIEMLIQNVPTKKLVTSRTMVKSEDMIITNPLKNAMYKIESWKDTLDTTAFQNFYNSQTNFTSEAPLALASGQAEVDRKGDYEASLTAISNAFISNNNNDFVEGTQCSDISSTTTEIVNTITGATPATVSWTRYPETTEAGGLFDTNQEKTMCEKYNSYNQAIALAAVAKHNMDYLASQGSIASTATGLIGTGPTTSVPKFLLRTPPVGQLVVDLASPEFLVESKVFEANSPYEVCAARLTGRQLAQSCIGNPNSEGSSVCATTAGSKGPENDIAAAWPATELTYFYYVKPDKTDLVVSQFRRLPLKFGDYEVALNNLEQIALKFKPDITGSAKVSILEPFAGGVGAAEHVIADNAFSKVYCGQLYGRTGISVPTFQTEYNGILQYHQLSLLTANKMKQDSVFFVAPSGAFVKVDVNTTINGSTGKVSYTVSPYSGATTTIAAPRKDPATPGTALPASDFVIYDFNGDGVVDMAAIHPATKQVSIRIGIGSAGGPLFHMDDPANVQLLDTLDSPVSIDVVRASTSSGVDLLVGYKEADSLTIYKYQNKGFAPNNMFQPGTHFNVGSKGTFLAAGAAFTSNIYTSGDSEAITTGVAFNDRYYFGNKGSTNDYVHSGIKRNGVGATVPASSIVAIKYDPALKRSSVSIAPIIPIEILRSTSGYFVTSNPSIVATADLNSDGLVDLITLDPKNRQFSVTYSSGNSTGFILDSESRLFNTMGIPSAVVAADFNLATDGAGLSHRDLAITNFDRDTVSIFFNGGVSLSSLNRNYTFNHTAYPAKEFAAGNGPVSIVAADLNQDGLTDLAIANQIGNNICVMYNDLITPGNFKPCVFYNVDLKPKTILAMDIHAPKGHAQGLIDLVVLSSGSRTVNVFVNNGKGFNEPIRYHLSEYYPSNSTLVDAFSEVRIDPFQLDHFKMLAGDIGWKIDGGGINNPTESPRWNSLVIGSEAMIYTMKNIGDKAINPHRASITKFTVAGNGSLSASQILTEDANSVIKAIAVTAGIMFVKSSLSPSLYQTTPQSIFRTDYLTAELKSLADTNLGGASSLLQTNTTNANPGLSQSALRLRNDDLGAGYEALVPVVHPTKGAQIYALHSGVNKGVMRLNLGSNPTYLIGGIKQAPASADPETQFGHNLSFNQPTGMIMDPNKLTLMVADKGNGFVRVIDLEKNITRTMMIGNNSNPQPIANLIGITNEQNTFNYFAITNNQLLKINVSALPITVTTQILSSGTDLVDSGFSAFKIQTYQNLLFAGARDNEIQPQTGRIYRVNTSQAPFERTTVDARIQGTVGAQTYDIKGLNGFTINPQGTKIYFSEWQTYQIKMIDLTKSVTEANITTLAGVNTIQGHFDGPNRYALLNRPGDLALNQDGTRLYFIDGSSIRSIDLTNLGTSGDLTISTIVGNPFDTGILDGFGLDVRFIRPIALHYEFQNGKDVLYVTDVEAHNVRKIVLQP